MSRLDPFIEQAIPHEAGHILVAEVVGMPIYGLDHIVVRSPDGKLHPGNFATRGVKPPDEDIPRMPPKVKGAYMVYVAGGLAGNIFANEPPEEHGIAVDRSDLARVTDLTLEYVAQQAQNILAKNKEAFDRLRAAIREKYLDLMKDPNIKEGRYPLLSFEEIEELAKNS